MRLYWNDQIAWVGYTPIMPEGVRAGIRTDNAKLGDLQVVAL